MGLKLLVLEILPNLEMWEHPLREILEDHHRVILVQVLVQGVTWVRRHLGMLSMGALLQSMHLHRETVHRWQMGPMDLLQEMGRRQGMNLHQEN